MNHIESQLSNFMKLKQTNLCWGHNTVMPRMPSRTRHPGHRPNKNAPTSCGLAYSISCFFFTHHLILSRGHVCRKPRAIQSPTAPQAVLIDQGAGEDIDLAILPQDRTGTWMIPGSYRWTLAEPWFSTPKNLFHSQPLIYGYYMVNILLILVEYGYYMVIYYMVNNG